MSTQDASQYKCPNCGAEIVFDPQTQKMVCHYCRSVFSKEDFSEISSEIEAEHEANVAQEEWFSEHTNLYSCSSCGAQIIAENNTTATFCYYCHNPVILTGKLQGDYRPSRIIGFKLTREQAEEKFNQWCGKRRFIPKDFRSQQQLEKMTGLYVPFWVADCSVKVDYTAIGKKVTSWTSGNYRITKTDEYSVTRNSRVHIDGIPADGESKIEDLLMESIEPFDYKELKAFDMSYFSGFYADLYDVDKAGVFPRIKERADDASKRIIRESISGYSSISSRHESYNLEKTKWEYIMLPVWFMSYRYNDKVYEFALNGQTGKLAGTPPLDKKKLMRFSAGIGLAVAAIIYLGGSLFL